MIPAGYRASGIFKRWIVDISRYAEKWGLSIALK